MTNIDATLAIHDGKHGMVCDLCELSNEVRRLRDEFSRSERDYSRLCEDWHASQAKLKRYDEREPLVLRLLASVQYARDNAALLGLLPMSRVHADTLAVRNFKMTDDDEACGSMSST